MFTIGKFFDLANLVSKHGIACLEFGKNPTKDNEEKAKALYEEVLEKMREISGL